MARGKRKVNTETLDTKIEQQKAVLEKAKAKYEAEKETLADLIKLRKEMRKEELMEYLENEPLDVLVTFGAGNIDRFIQPITEMLKARLG